MNELDMFDILLAEDSDADAQMECSEAIPDSSNSPFFILQTRFGWPFSQRAIGQTQNVIGFAKSGCV